MPVQQLTWLQAETLAARIANKATGFSKINPADKFTCGKETGTGADLIRCLHTAAILAFREAGALVEADAADARNITRKALAARAAQDAYHAAGGK